MGNKNKGNLPAGRASNYVEENRRRKKAVQKEENFIEDYVEGQGSYIDGFDMQNLQTNMEKPEDE